MKVASPAPAKARGLTWNRWSFTCLCVVTAGLGTFTYELVKELVVRPSSPWVSHSFTIAFVSALALAVACLAQQNATRLQTALTVLRGRGERTEAALQAVIEAVPAPAFLVGRDHKLLTLNQPLATRLGRTIDEMRGQDAFSQIRDQRVARERAEHMERVFQTGVATVFQDFNAGRHYANHLCPVRGADGAVWGVGVVAVDMTDLKQAEEQLGRKEELLRFGLAAAGLGVWEWDIGADSVTVSPEAIALMGGRPTPWRGTFNDFLQYVERVDRPRVETALRSAAAGRVATEPERFRARPVPRGPVRWAEVQARLFKGPEGRVRLIGTVCDATPKVEAEGRRQRAELTLQTVTQGTAGHVGRDFFSSLVEVLAASLGVRWVLVGRLADDGDLHNLAAWDNGPTDGRPLCAGGPLDELVAARWVAALGAGGPGQHGHVGDDANGHIPHIVTVPITSAEGHTLGLVAAMDEVAPLDLDMTRWVLALSAARAAAEIQRLDKEEEIMRLNADLERRVCERTTELTLANRELEAFSYSVSHDLRAPLRSIDGFALALIEDHGDQLDPGARQYIDIVRQESQRMAQIIDDLIGLARLTRSTLSRRPVNLSTISAQIVDDLRRRDPRRRVDVTIAPTMIVFADANLLRIALENLIGNAWKFTSRTPEARITVGMAGSAALPQFFVADNGAGFDDTLASKLFQPFARLHSAKEYEGTGLGLATVARVVKRHGGTVSARSRPGTGATISWTLPQRAGDADPDPIDKFSSLS